MAAAAVLETTLAPGVLDEDAAHGLCGRSEEVAAAIPLLCPLLIDQAKIRLMDQCSCLQGLPGLFLGHPLGSQFAQFIIDQRQQLLSGVPIALLDGAQY